MATIFFWCQCECTPRLLRFQNSIAFGSAPRRDVDSQPISPLARPAVSQTETHSLGFLSVANTAPSSGDRLPWTKQWPNGNTADRSFSGRRFEPRSGEYAAGAAAANSQPTRVRTADKKLASAALPFDRRLFDGDTLPHCLEPSERKLLTPPPSPPHPPPPSKK